MGQKAYFEFLTAKGIADAGQEKELARLKAALAQPGAKMLLHLHGGLVDQQSGQERAARLAGTGDHAFNAGPDWTQVYIVWRTGAFEELKRNWEELLDKDKLYKAIVSKLISFTAQRLSLPSFEGRAAADVYPLDEDEVMERLLGRGDTREPFADVDTTIDQNRGNETRAVMAPDKTSGELVLEFGAYLAKDLLFQSAIADINAAANDEIDGRSAETDGAVASGQGMLARLDDEVTAEIEPAMITDGKGKSARGLVSFGITLVRHASAIALRVFERFRHHRDHGLHATIVEEVCRELYGDLIGSKVWSWMVRDAALHFGPGGFGNELLGVLPAGTNLRISVTAHSAGAIWASHLLLAMTRDKVGHKIDLCLLAPAVRKDLFVEALLASSARIGRTHMFTMNDAFERRDAVLGHDKGYIYPSSLLYLVSGMFELRDKNAYVDAPLIGLQRFVGVSWLDPAETEAMAAVAQFFAQPDKAISYSKDAMTDADTHGGFDDNPLTLKSVKALFLS